MIYQGFLRPIEVTEDNRAMFLSAPYSVTLRLPKKVYASILTLLKEIDTGLKSLSAGFSVYLTEDWRVVIKHSSTNFDINFTDIDLGRLLGFRANITSTQKATATDKPQYCWLPDRHSYGANRFSEPPKNKFYGGISSGGYLSGIGIDSYKERTFKFDAISAPDIFKEAGLISYTWSGSKYYPDAERCFLQFASDAMGTVLTQVDSGNVSPKGCYYINNARDWTGETPVHSLPASMSAGGIRFDLNTFADRDKFVFCNFKVAPGIPRALTGKSAAYYELAFTLVTTAGVAWV